MFCVMYKHIASKLDQIFIFEMICESKKKLAAILLAIFGTPICSLKCCLMVLCSFKVDFNTRVLVF